MFQTLPRPTVPLCTRLCDLVAAAAFGWSLLGSMGVLPAISGIDAFKGSLAGFAAMALGYIVAGIVDRARLDSYQTGVPSPLGQSRVWTVAPAPEPSWARQAVVPVGAMPQPATQGRTTLAATSEPVITAAANLGPFGQSEESDGSQRAGAHADAEIALLPQTLLADLRERAPALLVVLRRESETSFAPRKETPPVERPTPGTYYVRADGRKIDLRPVLTLS